MAYTRRNYTSKAAIKRDMAEGIKVYVESNQLGHENEPLCNQHVYLEGPHYPQPHKWYAQAQTDAEGAIVPGTLK